LSHLFMEIFNLGPYSSWNIYVIITLQKPN
jgi:hypothetical protein